MTHIFPISVAALALFTLSACAADEAPAAEPSPDATKTIEPQATEQSIEQASEQSADTAQPKSETTASAEQGQRIVITGFECGDNCYLDYRPLAEPTGKTDDEIQSALCSVDRCADWFGEQAMPPEFVGRTATITVKQGKQYDNAGTVMSDDFPEVSRLTLDLVE